MSRVVRGIVRDGKVELVGGPELADGQGVQVVIDSEAPIEPAPTGRSPAEGVVATPLADPAVIEHLARVHRDRSPLPPSPTGPGRTSAAGMLADDATWDEHLRDVLESRKADAIRESPG